MKIATKISMFFATVAAVLMYSSTALAAAPITSLTDVDTGGRVNALYDINPQPVRETFERYGWTVDIVSSDTINALYGLDPALATNYSLAGFVSPQRKKMFLTGDVNYASQAVNHEMGHFFDICISPFILPDGIQASQTSDFVSVYLTEGCSGILGAYAMSSPDEYFAEAYKYYVEAPVFLATYAPYTYLYMDKVVNMYTEDRVFATLVNLTFIEFVEV